MTSRRPASASPDAVRELYQQAVAEYGPALKRLTRAYEADAGRREDLLQELHLALWRSFERFDGRCGLGTWVYRVAHNTASSICIRRRRNAPQLVSLEDIDVAGADVDRERIVDDRRAMDRLLALIHQLRPLDRQVMLLYLEGLDAASTGEIVGVSAGNVATMVHRIKKILAQRIHQGGTP